MKQNNFNNTLKPFRNQVLKNSVLHSGLLGCIVGLIVASIVALVSWFFGYDKGLLVSILTFIGAAVVSSVILCFTKFRVTDGIVAKKIDNLGLKERAITMIDFEKDNSYVANLQREDAKNKIKTLSPKQIKFKASKGVLSSLGASFIFCCAAISICVFAALGYIPSGLDIVSTEAAPAEILVIYEADEGGYIDGTEDQVVLSGEKTEPVLAVANDGWVFVGWSDGVTDPYREGDVVEEDTIFTAFFEEIDPEEDDANGNGNGNGNGQGQGNGDGNGASDMPGQGQGQGQGNGNGNGQGQGESNGDGKGEGAGGKYEDANKVYDGNTAYGDVFDDALEGAMDGLDTSTTEGDVIDGYFKGLD